MAGGRHRLWLIGGLVFLFLGLLAAFLYVPPALAVPSHDVGAAGMVNVYTTTDEIDPQDDVCSLREALETKPGCVGDTIYLQPTTYTLTDAVAGDLTITTTTNMNIRVSGVGQAVIQGGPGWNDRILRVQTPPNVVVTLSNVIIQGGRASDLSQLGGGVYNTSVLALIDCKVFNNSASLGGGIANTGPNASLWLTNTMVISNAANLGNEPQGGGIYNAKFVSLYNSAVVSNTTLHSGGGIAGEGTSDQAILKNVTVSGNSANDLGGGILNGARTDATYVTIYGNGVITPGNGGGIYSGFTTVVITSSILAGNLGGDCAGVVPSTSGGYNLIQTNCNVYPTTGDITGVNPLLGPLQDNRGPISTLTHALDGSSQAVNHIPSSDSRCQITGLTDQRGVERPQGSGCDIGAFELESGSNLNPEVWLPMLRR